ncbi:putative F-box domain-containing protein [Lupinus albus]|uniref:Putative F-box domain-containing protein n=1 Tax=Lupinus albus TaxID=3870 RepID=A0A6A4NS21_LUPAL|nr:putative F-box domain-containing protein [Lupinus albus]
MLTVPSTMHNMEEDDDEGIVEGENKGKQNMLIGKDEEHSKWTHIPSDILEMIMGRLTLTDYLGTSAVCSSWSATFAEAIANKHIKPLPEMPLVFLQPRKKLTLANSVLSIKAEEICSVINKSTGIPESHHVYHGSVEGWMILSICLFVGTAKIIFFLNPVTSDVVIVPSPLKFPSNFPIPRRSNLNMGRMVASSSPKCEDCVLVGFFNDYEHIAYCRVNYDKSWTMIEAKQGGAGIFLDVEIFNGKLYVRTNMSSTSMLVYDLQDSTDNPPKPIVLGNVPPIRPLPELVTHENQIHVKGDVIRFLTTGYAAEELLLIYLFNNYVFETGSVGYMNIINQYTSSPQVTKCEVFKLDTRSNEWVKLDHLGDRVIFLGYDKSFVMSRTLLNCSEELITENSVYFALHFSCPNPWMKIQLGRICLTDNKVKYFSLEELGLELDAYPSWFLPSAW